MRIKLTAPFVAKASLPAIGDRVIYWDTSLPCFGLVVTASGHRSFAVQYRAGRRSRRLALKAGLMLEEARKEARKIVGAVAKGGDPLAERRQAERAKSHTFYSVAEKFLARESKLRSAKLYRATLERLVYPKFGKDPIAGIRKQDVNDLLDVIEDERGPIAARQTLAVVRRVMNWHAVRSDDYRSPIVPGMGPKASDARERILSDDELRAIWNAAASSQSAFGGLVRFLLLTGVRRTEAAGMRRDEIAGDEWTIPAARSKGKRDMLVPLSTAALAVIAGMPVIEGCPFVFTVSGKRPINDFSGGKVTFDKACGVSSWTLHDLRRTARSLMSRAGVSSDHAERCLGHVIGGVRGVYDRHAFAVEKRQALEALASLIGRILDPPADNVVALHS